MKEIKLIGKYSINKSTLVDSEFFDYLSQWKWSLNSNGYVKRYDSKNKQIIFIHRLILPPLEGFEIDHVDGNPLNNQKDNLRLCTHVENLRNNRKRKDSQSRFKGVHFSKRKYWTARISHNYKMIYLGTFKTEIEAALSYNKAARKYFNKFAKLNII